MPCQGGEYLWSAALALVDAAAEPAPWTCPCSQAAGARSVPTPRTASRPCTRNWIEASLRFCEFKNHLTFIT